MENCVRGVCLALKVVLQVLLGIVLGRTEPHMFIATVSVK